MDRYVTGEIKGTVVVPPGQGRGLAGERLATRPLARRYGLVFLAVGLAALLTLMVARAGSAPADGLFYLAVIVSAWYGGRWPGIVATLLSALAEAYLLLDQIFTDQVPARGDLMNVGLFVLVALITVSLISSRRRFEAELRRAKARLEQTLAGIDDDFVMYDQDWRYVYANDRAAQTLGFSKEQLIGQRIWDLFPDAVGNLFYQKVHQARSEGRMMAFEHYYPPFGRWFENRVYPVPDGLLLFSTDITERKQVEAAEQEARRLAEAEIEARRQAEQRLATLLEEKEILLREVNHRIKNNLQAVSNLLSLQAQTFPDPQARRKFEESQNRVKSIALIHEMLYRSQNFTQVDFAGYVERLAGELIRTYHIDPEQIRLVVTGDRVVLGVDEAVSAAIIANELVTNCLKYAFPDGRAGEVRIELERQAKGRFRLAVCDNGVGLPEETELSRSGSLGLNLVQVLAGHLQGEMVVERTGGTRVTVMLQALPEEDDSA